MQKFKFENSVQNSMHKVTSVGDDVDDDIYIMVKCMSVCMYVTFLLILPSPKVFTPDDLPRPSRPKAALA